ncbi:MULTISPECIES: hypothetical protein [unclassified Pedobacter]|uniref:hypothetical protein n=1 Tax=unclassified Pedobacter TaxID=2628915 RepID=UPI001420EE0C|nr:MULTISPECIES: hypothetical protein [unclassified Pedobacter]NII84578.1 hypothetical protein [Pedobacter sp. SG908]NMN38508.1 hypothetical protein [Pedobacter sp. SG918]
MFDKDKSIFFDNLSKVEVNPETTTAIRALQNRNFKPQWPVGHKMDYGLRMEMYADEKIHEIKYELQVERLENTVENFTCFAIDRMGPVYINEIEPDLLADQLAYKVSTAFYPMNVVLDAQGTVLEIQNISDIKRRWQTVKTEINQTFEGPILDEYMHRMEKNIEDPFVLNLAFKDQDWFLNVFFLPIYRNYHIEDEPASALYFPILPFRNTGYSSSFVLNPHLNDLGMIEINVNGKMEAGETENYAGNYSGRYLLHPHNKQIWMIKSMYTFESAMDQKYVKLDVFCLKDDGQELDFSFEHTAKKITSSGLAIANKRSEKKSFWKSIFG